MPIIIISFQHDETIEPIVANGSWDFAEHLLRQYGDENGFVPNNKLILINVSGNKFLSYVGTLSKTGRGEILQATDFMHRHPPSFTVYEQKEGEELIPYIISEWLTVEEDWRE